MPKRRTRKQKIQPKHTFLYQWSKTKSASQAGVVKGQFINEAKKQASEAGDKENANLLEKDVNLTAIKKNILKSLILTSLVLCLELVLYLARSKLF
jgi:hypothetical protein